MTAWALLCAIPASCSVCSSVANRAKRSVWWVYSSWEPTAPMNSMSALESPVVAEKTPVSKALWAASARSSESRRLPVKVAESAELRSRPRPSMTPLAALV